MSMLFPLKYSLLNSWCVTTSVQYIYTSEIMTTNCTTNLPYPHIGDYSQHVAALSYSHPQGVLKYKAIYVM